MNRQHDEDPRMSDRQKERKTERERKTEKERQDGKSWGGTNVAICWIYDATTEAR